MIVNYGGNSAYVYTGGEDHQAGAPCVCFIHGAAMDHSVWTLFSRYWAKSGYNVVAIDLPGHGLSGGEPLSRIELQADFVAGLLEQLQLSDAVHLVGHSMGSLVALECAVRLSNTKCLAMMGTAYPMAVGQPLLDAAKANDHSSIDMISLFGHSFGSQIGSNPVAGISVQNLAERLLENSAAGVLFSDLSACQNYRNGEVAAASLACTTGLILGELDQMTSPAVARKFARSFKNVNVMPIPDCGHMMMTEKPESAHSAIVELFEAAQRDQKAAST